MAVPQYHVMLTDARNKLATACETMNQAGYENENYMRFYAAMSKLLERIDREWSRNVKRGRKEGWFK